MKYLLDTNICIYFLKKSPDVVQKIKSLPNEELAISCFNLAELLYGAYNSENEQKNLERVRFIERAIQVLEFERRALEIFSKTKAHLRKQGNLIDDIDILIGAIALSNNLILVTNNEKHFSRIPGLRI